MQRTLAIFIMAWICAGPRGTARGADEEPPRRQVTEEDYARAEAVGRDFPGLVYRTRVVPRWVSPDHFWYTQQLRDDWEWVWVDAAEGARNPISGAGLAEAMAAHLDVPPPAAFPFVQEVKYPAGDDDVLLQALGRWWRLDPVSHACVPAEAAPPSVHATSPASGEAKDGGRASPDGRWRVRDGASRLLLVDADGTETMLAGSGEDAFEYRFAGWSPDSRYVVVRVVRPGPRLTMFAMNSLPDRGLRPSIEEKHYPLPGEPLAARRFVLFHVPDGRRVDLAMDFEDGGLDGPFWSTSVPGFLFTRAARYHASWELCRVDPESGGVTVLVREQTDTFFQPARRLLRILDKGPHALFTSPRSGWHQLYRVGLRTGEILNAVTTGAWVVRDIDDLDEEAGTVLVWGSGHEPGQDPYFQHLYRARLDGSSFVRLTDGDGTHEVQWSPDRRYFLDRWSRVDAPPVTVLRRGSDGSLVTSLERADISDIAARGPLPQPFVAKGRDGETDIWGVVYRPSFYAPDGKYPVVENIYAGPHEAFVPKSFSPGGPMQQLAELGFIVVQLDGMGTAHRSKAFHDVAHRNLADGGFPDRIAWIRALAASDPAVDLARIGISGTSAGGYNAAWALIGHPDFYTVAVAHSGNYDHRTDKASWVEQWMGAPGPHYAEQSCVEQAHRLRGRLLLIHGEMDENVYMNVSTLPFIHALIQANKDFEHLYLPGLGHGAEPPYVRRRRWDFFVRHLHQTEPPREYAMTQGNAFTFTMTNAAAQAVEVFWVREDGGRTSYRVMQPGEQHRQHSYLGHAWEAVAADQVRAHYVVNPRRPTWTIP